MFKDEIENEKPDKILKIAEESLDFNKKNPKATGLATENINTRSNAS